MCGIAGMYVKEQGRGKVPINDLLDYLLLNIESRGRDATGYVAVPFEGSDGQFVLNKAPIRASEFLVSRPDVDEDTTQIVLAHTRFATQGKPEENSNNHPVVWGSCYATHNGHISNDSTVLTELGIEDRGNAEVDSIAIAAALAHHGFNDDEELKKALGLLSGNMAIAAINPEQSPGKLLLAKGASSPLYVINARNVILWASTAAALKNSWGWAIGTPPNTKAAGVNCHGAYDVRYGEAWVIEGDEARLVKFQPKTYQYRGGSEDWDGYGWHRSGGHLSNGTHVAGYYGSDRKVWTCSPHSWSCTRRCIEGCSTNKCLCFEWQTWDQGKRKYVPKADALSIARDGWDDDHENDLQQRSLLDNEEEAVVKCDGCYDWYPVKETVEAPLQYQNYVLCLDCAVDDDHFSMFVHRQGAEDETATAHAVQEATEADQKAHDDRLKHYQLIAEAENEKHKTCIEATAKALGSSTEFVDWLLFTATLEEIDSDPEFLKPVRKQADTIYDREYRKASTGGN